MRVPEWTEYAGADACKNSPFVGIFSKTTGALLGHFLSSFCFSYCSFRLSSLGLPGVFLQICSHWLGSSGSGSSGSWESLASPVHTVQQSQPSQRQHKMLLHTQDHAEPYDQKEKRHYDRLPQRKNGTIKVHTPEPGRTKGFWLRTRKVEQNGC